MAHTKRVRFGADEEGKGGVTLDFAPRPVVADRLFHTVLASYHCDLVDQDDYLRQGADRPSAKLFEVDLATLEDSVQPLCHSAKDVASLFLSVCVSDIN